MYNVTIEEREIKKWLMDIVFPHSNADWER